MADPFTALGAAAAVAQFLGQCVGLGQLAGDLYNSFHDAPDQLNRLALKAQFLGARVRYLTQLAAQSNIDVDEILPVQQLPMLLKQLDEGYHALSSIKSLLKHNAGVGARIATKLRWAALDHRRAERALTEIEDVEKGFEMNIVLLGQYTTCHIPPRMIVWLTLHSRISTIHQTSLTALRAGQSVMLPMVAGISEEMASLLQAQNFLSKTICNHQTRFHASMEAVVSNQTSTMALLEVIYSS
jgi:hypothetical protein